MRRLKTVRRPPIYPKTPGHLLCSSLTHPLPLSSRRPSVSFGGFGLTGVALSLAFVPQTKNPGISLVDKDGVDAGLAPLPSSGTGDAPFVEGASDVSHSVTSLGQVEDAPDDGSRVKWRASH